MNTTSYWFDSSKRPTFRPLARSLSVDVLVVGGGVTGIVTASLLQKAGVSVALLERERLASRDSGHTTAHLTHVMDKRLHELVKDFGRDHARAAWDAGAAAIDEIERIVREENIECEFSRVPGYLHAPVSGGQSDERPNLKKDAKLANELGFNAAYLDRVPFMNTPGVRFADQAKFHPLKFLFALAQQIHGNGVRIFENSAVTEFDSKKKRAKANGHWVNYDRVVLATNNPVLGETGLVSGTLFQTKLALYSSYVVGATIPRASIPIASFWDTNDPYQYLRVDRQGESDYAIFGGEDHKTGQARNTETCFRNVEKALFEIAPQAKIEHRWSGQVIDSADGLPYIGPNQDDQFIGTAYSGNGYTFGVTAAVMARDWITGVKNPWRDLFSPDRKAIRGDMGLPAREQGLSLLPDPGSFPRARGQITQRGQTWRGQDFEVGPQEDRRLSRRARDREEDVPRLHPHGLPRALESGRIDLGLSLPRLAFRPEGKRPLRPRRDSAGRSEVIPQSANLRCGGSGAPRAMPNQSP